MKHLKGGINMAEKEKNKPIFKVRSGNMAISVFSNTAKKDNKEFSYNSVVLQRSYLKKDGDAKKNDDWIREVINFRPNDLIKLLTVLNKTQEFLFLKGDLKEVEE